MALETGQTPASTSTPLLRQRWRPGFTGQAEITTSTLKLPQTPSVEAARWPPLLLSYLEIPEWYRDNKYILYRYRPVTGSTTQCFASWFYVHNETLNLFSHLVPAVCSLICGVLLRRLFLVRWPNATTGDQIVFGLFLFTAMICLLMSSFYHTLMNQSASVSQLWLRLDYVGIVLLTLGDFVSGIYLIFYGEPTLQRRYWTMASALPRVWSSKTADERVRYRRYAPSLL